MSSRWGRRQKRLTNPHVVMVRSQPIDGDREAKVTPNRPKTCSGFGLPFGILAVLAVLVSLASAPGCDGWEGDVIAPGADTSVDPASLLICPPETMQIRLLFSDGRLATYHPDAVSPLSDVVQLSCGAQGPAGQPPTSFAVDRHGDVWIVDGKGTLFRARRGSGACVKMGFDSASAGGPFRMAFVADAAAPDKETLYVAIGTNRTATGVPQSADLAPLNLAGAPVLGKRVKLAGWPILSGTGELSAGNGQLWGLFPAMGTTESYAAEIDPRTGTLGPKMFPPQDILSPRLPSFVVWRGNFWVFPGRPDETPTVGLVFPDSAASGGAESAEIADRAVPIGGEIAGPTLPREGELTHLDLSLPSPQPLADSGWQPEVVSAAVSTCATPRQVPR